MTSDAYAKEAGADIEKHNVVTAGVELKRRLKSRHLQMIAIGMIPFSPLFLSPSCICMARRMACMYVLSTS